MLQQCPGLGIAALPLFAGKQSVRFALRLRLLHDELASVVDVDALLCRGSHAHATDVVVAAFGGCLYLQAADGSVVAFHYLHACGLAIGGRQKHRKQKPKQLVLVCNLVLIALQFGANKRPKQVVLVEDFSRFANSLAVTGLREGHFRPVERFGRLPHNLTARLYKAHGIGGDALLSAGETEALGGGGFDGDVADVGVHHL